MFCGGFGPFGSSFSGTLGLGWFLLATGFRLLIFAGLIFVAVKLLKNYSNNTNKTMRILDEKFASGEISEEEYLKRKAVLSQKN
jgi:putative membrane protein